MLYNQTKNLALSMLFVSALSACGSDNNNDEQNPIPDTTAPVLSLVGDANLNHEAGTNYSDAGASATDDVDGTISANIVVNGSVDTSTIGTYTLTYNVSDSSGNSAASITRTVNVSDTLRPEIVLLGEQNLTIEVGASYTEAGATATDFFEGDLSNSIIVTGSVDTSLIGSYELSYNVSDTSGNAATTAIRTVSVVDTTAPIIVSVSPQADASDVAVTETITVTFNEAIANNSISNSAFVVTDSQSASVDGLIDIDAMGTMLSFQAAQELVAGEQYSVTISTDITDVSINALTNAFTWQFTTVEASQANFPTLINEPGSPASEPYLAVNSTGEAIAAWRQGSDLKVNMYSPQNNWGGVEELSFGNTGFARKEVKVAIADNGDAIAAWINDTGQNANTTVAARRYTKANGWENVFTIDGRDGLIHDVDVAIDNNGNAMLLWPFSGNSNQDPGVYVRRYNKASGTWGNAYALIGNEDTTYTNPSIAMNNAGQAIAAWVVDNEIIQSAIYDAVLSGNNAPWLSAQSIGLSSEDSIVANYVDVAINEQGEAVATWVQSTNTNTSGDIYASYYSPANNWRVAEPLELMSAGEARYPQVAMYNEQAIVVWTEYDGSRYSVYSNMLSEQKQWLGPLLLENNDYDAGNSNAAGALVDIDARGGVTIAWEQDSFISEIGTTRSRLFLNRFNLNETPSTSEIESLEQAAPLAEAYRPALGVDALGNAIVVTQRLLNNSLDIQAHSVSAK